MARPSQVDKKRQELIPVVARTFAELGYRRTSTAELGKRCGVQENILYRLWPDKKAMFIASIDYVFAFAAQVWEGVAEGPGVGSAAEKVLSYESRHAGDYGHSRIVFAGLNETDDADIRAALSRMYKHYQSFLRDQVRAHRHKSGQTNHSSEDLTAWAFVGLGTVALIARELKLLSDRQRRRLMTEIGQKLLA